MRVEICDRFTTLAGLSCVILGGRSGTAEGFVWHFAHLFGFFFGFLGQLEWTGLDRELCSIFLLQPAGLSACHPVNPAVLQPLPPSERDHPTRSRCVRGRGQGNKIDFYSNANMVWAGWLTTRSRTHHPPTRCRVLRTYVQRSPFRTFLCLIRHCPGYAFGWFCGELLFAARTT